MGREADRYDSFNIAIVLSVSGMLPGSPSGQQVLLEPECITRASLCASAATPYLARLFERKHQSRIMQISELSLHPVAQRAPSRRTGSIWLSDLRVSMVHHKPDRRHQCRHRGHR